MSKTNLEIIKKIPSVDLILQDSYVKKQEEKEILRETREREREEEEEAAQTREEESKEAS